jgi:hypothetical protein
VGNRDPSIPKPPEPHDDLLPRRRPHRSATKRVVHLSIGIGLIVIGIVFAILPIVPGWPLTIVGLVYISMADDRVRRWLNRGDRRLPGGVRRGLRWARTKTKMSREHRSEAERARPKSPRPKQQPRG